VLIVWLCFVARGTFYTVLLPMWEGYDEWAHVAYVQRLASGGGLPVLGQTVISREVAESLELTPLAHAHPSMTGARLTHDAYWRLPEHERESRRRRLLALERAWAAQQAAERILNHEAQQPPVYHSLLAPIQLVAGSASLPARVWLMRFVSLLITSLTIPLAFLVARRVVDSDGWAVGVTALIASMPGFLMNASRVGNDGISAVVFTALMYALLCGASPWSTGGLLGLGLLIKASFLTAVPALACASVFSFVRASRAALACAIAAALSSWWYWRNYRLTGSWSGLQQVVASGDTSMWSVLGAIPRVDWLRYFDIAWMSHIWHGNWSFLQLRSWMYRVFAALAIAAIVGLLLKLRREEAGAKNVAVLAAVYGFFWLGLCYHELCFHMLGLSSGAGWYLYAVVVAEILLGVAGLEALCAPRWRGWVSPVCAGLFALLDLYATHFVLLPYYTGQTAHKAGGALAAFRIGQFAELPVMLDRLSAPAAVAWLLWLGYLAATAALPLLAAYFGDRLRWSETTSS